MLRLLAMLKKRIPTILGILLLLAGITAGVYLVELGPQPLTTRATPEVVPAPGTSTTSTLPPTPQSTESAFTLDELAQPTAQEGGVSLYSPGEGEAVNTQTPEFFGGGPPGTSLEITLESEQEIQGETMVDTSGQLSWSPDSPVEPGEHFLTIRWLDGSGLAHSITRRFVVYAQGESSLPSFEATPSATATPTPTPTPVQLAAVSPTPTPIATPTPTPTPKPTPTIAPSTPSAVATEPSLPVPGTGLLSLGVILLGIGLLVSGVFFMLREQS